MLTLKKILRFAPFLVQIDKTFKIFILRFQKEVGFFAQILSASVGGWMLL